MMKIALRGVRCGKKIGPAERNPSKDIAARISGLQVFWPGIWRLFELNQFPTQPVNFNAHSQWDDCLQHTGITGLVGR